MGDFSQILQILAQRADMDQSYATRYMLDTKKKREPQVQVSATQKKLPSALMARAIAIDRKIPLLPRWFFMK